MYSKKDRTYMNIKPQKFTFIQCILLNITSIKSKEYGCTKPLALSKSLAQRYNMYMYNPVDIF